MLARTLLMAILLSTFGSAQESARIAPSTEEQVGPANQVQIVTVDATPGHATNTYSPMKDIGAGLDSQSPGEIPNIYSPKSLDQMLASGLGAVSYRLFTEESVQDWHWNPQGSWSESGQEGYWIGAAAGSEKIKLSVGYRLPHRGFTHDQGLDDNYSRLTDGNLKTYWKSDPYLTEAFTHEPDAAHPQWIVVDLGARHPVNAIQIDWVSPYATGYVVQYWTGPDAMNRPTDGHWIDFPYGSVTNSPGGTVLLSLSPSPIKVEFLRVLMTASSDTCDTHDPSDVRNCVGYAIAEVFIGTQDRSGFHDLVHHVPNNHQTVTYCSSVDPWHSITDKVHNQQLAGLDLVFTSGITRGLPAMVAVGMVYGTPDDAAAEIRYLEAKQYPISYVEMGEEPDGQYFSPEDYGALYLQWASALHAVDPKLKLGGPVFQIFSDEVLVWPDAEGNASFLNRFLRYLANHGRMSDLAFESSEHYPFNACGNPWQSMLDEPDLVGRGFELLKNAGVPSSLPIFITEYNYTPDYSSLTETLASALWQADFVGAFLSQGGHGLYYYEYEPTPISDDGCGWGTLGMFTADQNSRIRAKTAQFFSSQMLTQEWSQPVDADHQIYPVSIDITNSEGKALVTAYAVLRPDGQWAVMFINKDKLNPYDVNVVFRDSAANVTKGFAGPVSVVTLDRQQYAWHKAGANGYPAPDGPLEVQVVLGGKGIAYGLPAGSLTVLRGTVR